MTRPPPRTTRTDTLVPYTTRFRSGVAPRRQAEVPRGRDGGHREHAESLPPPPRRQQLRQTARPRLLTPADSPFDRLRTRIHNRKRLMLSPSKHEPAELPRSEERRVGKECVRTCRSRRARYHTKKKN